MNEVLKMHNNFTDLALKSFSAVEMDILLEICYEVSEKGTTEVTLPFSRILEMTSISNHDNKWFVKSLRSTNKKLMQLNMTIINPDNTNEVVDFVLFPEFAINEKSRYLRVQVAQKFVYLLNDLTKNYTRVELKQSMSLHSSYSKQIYRQLARYRYTGWWEISLENFNEYLDIPKCYKQTNIDSAILEPAVKELSLFFTHLKVEKLTEKSYGKVGRPKVCGYRFTFDKTEKPDFSPKETNEKSKADLKNIASASGYSESARYCPICHKRVFEKTIVDSDTGDSYKLWGHPDFKTGKCRWSTFDYQNCLTQMQLEKIENPVKLTEEQKENIEKLNALLNNTFKR